MYVCVMGTVPGYIEGADTPVYKMAATYVYTYGYVRVYIGLSKKSKYSGVYTKVSYVMSQCCFPKYSDYCG